MCSHASVKTVGVTENGEPHLSDRFHVEKRDEGRVSVSERVHQSWSVSVGSTSGRGSYILRAV